MYIPSHLPPEWESRVRAELESMETVKWFGVPRPMSFVWVTIPIVLFAIPWTAFAIFWICGASGFKLPDLSHFSPANIFPLFGLPFVLVGLGMLLSPLWAIRAAKKTGYVLTNRRAILFGGGFGSTVRSIEAARFNQFERRERSNGTGDIIFEYVQRSSGNRSTRSVPLGFIGIENVREVEKLVRAVAQSSTPAVQTPHADHQ